MGKVLFVASIVIASSELISRATGELAMHCLSQNGWILEKGAIQVILSRQVNFRIMQGQ